ncbi:hypothetical protein ACEPAG_9192 [Sanghuangporus baumii]
MPSVSAVTVHRALREQGFRQCKAIRKPYLRKKDKEARLKWAKQRRHMSVEDLGYTVFSDECYICIGDKPGAVYVTRRPDEASQESCFVPVMCKSSVSIMVWACVMLGKKGPLVMLNLRGGKGGGLSAEKYQEWVLEAALLNFFIAMVDERGDIDF